MTPYKNHAIVRNTHTGEWFIYKWVEWQWEALKMGRYVAAFDSELECKQYLDR